VPEVDVTMVGRYATLGLIAGQGVTNWSFRNGIPAWIPFVVSSLQFTDVERALLMASFFPGYLLTQIPGAALIQKYGAKAVLLVDMAGTSVLCLLAPLAAASSARALAGLLTVMGLFQGPLIPAIQVLKRSWLPDGPEKALVLRFMSLPFVLSEVLALTVYPWLSVNFGWRAMPICHGVSTGIYALAWLALVKDEPGSELLAAEAQEKQESTPAEVQEQEQEPRRAQTLDAAVAPDSPPAPANGTTEKRPTASTVEWRVFTVPSGELTRTAHDRHIQRFS
jgi:MFS family permease